MGSNKLDLLYLQCLEGYNLLDRYSINTGRINCLHPHSFGILDAAGSLLHRKQWSWNHKSLKRSGPVNKAELTSWAVPHRLKAMKEEG